jgi:hypothetical protein
VSAGAAFAARPASRLTEAQIADAKRVNILAYLPGLKPWSRTDGGEYHGPCPLCGGKDRMIAWPAHSKGPRARCRQCHPGVMDAIALVQWLGRARDFPAAVALLTGPATAYTPPAPPVLDAPSRPYRPPYDWQTIADYYAYYAPTPTGPSLSYMKERREPGPRGKSKTFYQCHPRPGIITPRRGQPADWYEGRGDPLQLWPYNWPAVLALGAGAVLLWVDGEKDVKTARRAGLVAVCGPDGGDSWEEQWGPLFCNHPAIIIPDTTSEGPAQAERAARLIAPYADSVQIVPVPAKDLTAWAEARKAPEGETHAA